MRLVVSTTRAGRANANEPALRSQDPIRRPLSVAGGIWQKALPDAWWRARIRSAKRKSKRFQARQVHERRD
jgi:hypothetical protein